MNRTSKQSFVRLTVAAALAVGLSGTALAQQGMATATDSELDASWVDGRIGQDHAFAGASQVSRFTAGNSFTDQQGPSFPDEIRAGRASSQTGSGLNSGTNSRDPANAGTNWPL